LLRYKRLFKTALSGRNESTSTLIKSEVPRIHLSSEKRSLTFSQTLNVCEQRSCGEPCFCLNTRTHTTMLPSTTMAALLESRPLWDPEHVLYLCVSYAPTLKPNTYVLTLALCSILYVLVCLYAPAHTNSTYNCVSFYLSYLAVYQQGVNIVIISA